jgi:predicted secreted protein
MTKRAKRALGTKLKIGLDVVSDLSSIGSPSITQDEIDVTTLDSDGEYREFIAGFKDAGEVSTSGYFVPSNEGQAALYAALESSEIQTFEIIYPAELGASWSFEGFVSAYNVNAELEDAISFDATIRVSGQPFLNFDQSSGLTALSLTGTDGALEPTFANGVSAYAFTGITASSITVTATAANHELTLYVDGVKAQTLTSGSPSVAINLPVDSSKELTIAARESGKASKTYRVIATRA